MKDLKESIMVDGKEWMNENMKEFMKEITVNVKSNIIESMNIWLGNKNQNNITPNPQPKPTTQETPQPKITVEELKYLIDEMDITKSPNKLKLPIPSSEIENQNQETQERGNDSTI